MLLGVCNDESQSNKIMLSVSPLQLYSMIRRVSSTFCQGFSGLFIGVSVRVFRPQGEYSSFSSVILGTAIGFSCFMKLTPNSKTRIDLSHIYLSLRNRRYWGCSGDCGPYLGGIPPQHLSGMCCPTGS